MFDVRAKFTDPDSLETTGTIYDSFTVTFTFICSSDVLSIDGVPDNTFIIGLAPATYNVYTDQTEASCASYTTTTYEAYDEASSTWVLA